jgi:hypothetical protein
MSTQEQIDAAYKCLDERWGASGECRSCGWHAALYEYGVAWQDIEDALENHDGVLRLPCLNHEDGDPIGHRGVRVDLKP